MFCVTLLLSVTWIAVECAVKYRSAFLDDFYSCRGVFRLSLLCKAAVKEYSISPASRHTMKSSSDDYHLVAQEEDFEANAPSVISKKGV